jgi:hypothetical protein
MSSLPPDLSTLQKKLQYLMGRGTDRQGKPYTLRSLAESVRHYCPELTTTPATIGNLLNAVTRDPSWRLIEGLAKSFGITTEFFRDAASPTEVQQALLVLDAQELLKRGDIRALATRAADFDRDIVEAITTMMVTIAERERSKRERPSERGTHDDESAV